jgi:hypothetical protein
MLRLPWLAFFGCAICLAALSALAQDTPQAKAFRQHWNKAKPLTLEQSIK